MGLIAVYPVWFVKQNMGGKTQKKSVHGCDQFSPYKA